MKTVRLGCGGLLAWGLAACSSGARPESQPPYDLLIGPVSVVDVAAGRVRPRRYVGIRGQRIEWVGARRPAAGGRRVVDGTGKYLVPGLWDMHVHYDWNAADASRLLLANGVVGVREMFGDVGRVREIRRQIAAGALAGPEIVASGPILDGPNSYWPGAELVADTATARRVVRRQVRQGVDFVKVYSRLPRDAYFAIAAEARRQGVPFAGHVPASISLYEAIAAGQRSTEHLYGLLEACTRPAAGPPPPGSYWTAERQLYLKNSFSRPRFDSLRRVLARSNTWLCPTLVVLRGFAYIKDDDFRRDARVKYLPAYMRSDWDPADPSTAELPAGYFTAAQEVLALQKSLLGPMQQAGVKLLAGTDYPNPYCFPGFSLHDELQLLVEGGLTPTQALRTATLNPALYLEKTADYGAVAPGRYASLVLLDANPLQDIAHTRRLAAVLLKGRYFARPALDSLLRRAEERAAQLPVSSWFARQLKTGGLAQAQARLDSLIQQKSDRYDHSERELNALGYQLLRSQQVKPALAIFALNVRLYPGSANVYDSYAEALAADGQRAAAIAGYQQALARDSTNRRAQEKMEALRAKP